jgi:8-oxo-dGTP pyrophosphatase MutT (NUDIX family)
MVAKIIVSGPVIIEEGKLLVINDGKDSFYKIPGGKVKEGESLEETCLRELEEETVFRCRIVRKLSTLELHEKPETGEKVDIELHHYRSILVNPPKNYEPFIHGGHKVMWINVNDLSHYSVSPNISYLFERGELT